MANKLFSISWAGQTWQLLPEKALFWEERRALIVADVHIGKAAAFRSHGLQVPEMGTHEDLQRLQRLVSQTGAQRLIILGDFFHSARGKQRAPMDTLDAWIEELGLLRVDLILGNHDVQAGPPPDAWGWSVHEKSLHVSPVEFCHHPCEKKEGWLMAGHIHPAYRLFDPPSFSVRLPIFVFGRRQSILPAYGGFTGMSDYERRPGDRLFVIGDNEIIPLGNQKIKG